MYIGKTIVSPERHGNLLPPPLFVLVENRDATYAIKMDAKFIILATNRNCSGISVT